MSAFPLHIWTLLMSFRDVSWVAERTNMWDALGVISYGMVFAFFESVLVFVVLALIGFLVLPSWKRQRIPVLTALYFVLSVWSMFSQWYFLSGRSMPLDRIIYLAGSEHPLRVIYAIYAITFLVVFISFFLPVLLILHSPKTLRFFDDLIDRVGMLMIVYLIMDVLALGMVVFRNL